MPEGGHFQRLRTLISLMSGPAFSVHVLTHRTFQTQVERAGAIFTDLFAVHSLDDADRDSMPVPCRYVSFAGHFADDISREVEKLNPALIVHDDFAVIGRVVAGRLDVPRVNVCSGHNVAPSLFLSILEEDPRVRLSDRCHEAVEILRTRYGIEDASPFCYVSSLSPHLNLYCEPPAFLEESDRSAFEPIAFWGSLPSTHDLPRDDDGESRFGSGSSQGLKAYVSFGTVVWRYYADQALAALAAVTESFARMPDARVVTSLGGNGYRGSARARLTRPNVTVENWVDQWRVLRETDVFLTHHGLNSTHEAIYHRVPMISYPFFWDQPAQAERCQRFQLAIPLTDGLRAEVRGDDVDVALSRLSANRESMGEALSTAHQWETEVVANRPRVLQRISELFR
jgi:UDP:flavonoid glycosyltransferase YjiC (YdhE family)